MSLPYYAIFFFICLKILVYPGYYSTDFDVHKNWMRITTTLPLSQWYYDDYSKWTLDYPPLFAYFEYILGLVATKWFPEMLTKDNLNENDQKCILYQRFTVILCDLFYCFTILHSTKRIASQIQHRISPTMIILVINLFSLFLVDNVHFQYNSLMQGFLILACTKLYIGSYFQANIYLFSLLFFKHIYIYILPTFIVLFIHQKANLSRLLIFTMIFFLIVFYPFMDKQIVIRLFPIKRGLIHSYWAPNFWSLYCLLDLILAKLFRVYDPSFIRKSSFTSGVVQETVFDFLPNITPLISLISIVIASLFIYKNARKEKIFELGCLQSLIFYNFGFHVHEKAIIIPLTLSLMNMLISNKNHKLNFMSSFVNSLSLLPLIPPQQDFRIARTFPRLNTISHGILFRGLGEDRIKQV